MARTMFCVSKPKGPIISGLFPNTSKKPYLIDFSNIAECKPNLISYKIINLLSSSNLRKIVPADEMMRLFLCYERNFTGSISVNNNHAPQFRFPLPEEILEATICAAYQTACFLDDDYHILIILPEERFIDYFSKLFLTSLLDNSERCMIASSSAKNIEDFLFLSPQVSVLPEDIIHNRAFGSAEFEHHVMIVDDDFDIRSSEYVILLASSGYYKYCIECFRGLSVDEYEISNQLEMLKSAFVAACCLSDINNASDINETFKRYAERHADARNLVQYYINVCTIELRLRDTIDYGIVSDMVIQGLELSNSIETPYSRAFIKNISALKFAKQKDFVNAEIEIRESIGLLEEVITNGEGVSKEYGTLLLNLAMLQSMKGSTADAIETLDKAISHEPRNASFRHAKGNLLGGLDRHDDAILEFNEGIGGGFMPENLLLSLADQLERAGAIEECLAKLELTTKLYNGSIVGWQEAIRVCCQVRGAQTALEIAVEAIRRNHECAELWCTLAEVAAIVGDHKLALTAFSHAQEIDPANIAAIVGRSASLFELGDHSGARETLEAGREHHPQSEEILTNLEYVLSHSTA